MTPPLLRSAFRLFFVLATLEALFLGLAWTSQFLGHPLLPGGASLHGHELVFGFWAAVLCGFFLTAAPVWTKTPRLLGAKLVVLALWWAAARYVALSPAGRDGSLSLDAAFLITLAILIGLPILKSKSQRNLAFPAILLGLAITDIFWHSTPWAPTLAVQGLVFFVVIFGGRVTPLFTNKVLGSVRPRDLRDDLAIGLAFLVLLSLACPEPGRWAAALAGLSALAHAARMWGWRSRASGNTPILWILHLGYAWIVLATAMLAVSFWDSELLSPRLVLHAFTLGVLGSYAIGMLSRVALGHTGRPLKAPSTIVLAYLLIQLATLLRLFFPSRALPLAGSAAAWTLAFLLYLVTYLPILISPRPDGKGD